MDPLDDSQQSRELSDYILSAYLPECVTVTRGRYVTKSVQISKGDIIVLKSCDTRHITLSYRDKESGRRKELDVPGDCSHKFTVLPPKDTTSSRAVSIIAYPTISDLLIDSPTYFEATSSYNDPDFRGHSIKRGDRFRFKGIIISPEDGRRRLKADKEGNIVFLNFYCHGNFYPLEDDCPFTLQELINFAPVPRRLKLVRNEFQESSSEKSLKASQEDLSASNSISLGQNVAIPPSLPFSYHGSIHMLKPEVSVAVSPLNDPDTVWIIPLSANIQVKEYCIDEYEIPAAIKHVPKESNTASSYSPDVEEIPNFPAPSSPPMAQPLVPIDVCKFLDIYGCSFPVKAQIMDVSKCSPYYEKALCDYSVVIIHKLENSSLVYAKDEKADLIYSFSNSAKVSFIEYPQKFTSVSDLVNLATGTQVVVLEDIASDFPKHFSLQFGDIIRINSIVPVLIKVKHTNLECKVLKCQKMNQDGSAGDKLKLPLDFDVQMVISRDHNDQKVITIQDLISGKAPLPTHDVAVVIDNGQNKDLKDLPSNLRLLSILPERLLLTSLPQVNNSCGRVNKTLGISLNSGLVLAFRKRLEKFEIDRVKNLRNFVQQPVETLTSAEYKKRKVICKSWPDDEEQEIESVSSNDKSSNVGDSLDRSNSTGLTERKEKKKAKDKMKRLSRAFNPKHWRASKAPPDPLPHPEALGLMALAVRPHYEKPNDYQEKLSTRSSLDQTWSSFGATSDEEEEKNIYEDVDVGPIKDDASVPSQDARSRPFSGPLHQSLPMSRVAFRSQAKRRKERASHATHQVSDEKTEDTSQAKKLAARSTSPETETEKPKKNNRVQSYDDSHIYEYPDGSFAKPKPSKWTNMQTEKNDGSKNDLKYKSLPRKLPRMTSSNASVESVPADEYAKVRKSPDGVNNSMLVKKQDPTEYIECDRNSSQDSTDACTYTTVKKKTSLEPPVPPRRKKKIEATKMALATVETSRLSADPGSNKKSDETLGDINKENLSGAQKSQSNYLENSSASVQAPVPKPRGMKKRTYINPENNYIETDLSAHTRDKLDSLTIQDCVTGIDRQSQNTFTLAADQIAKSSVKPKPPPKPRLKP